MKNGIYFTSDDRMVVVLADEERTFVIQPAILREYADEFVAAADRIDRRRGVSRREERDRSSGPERSKVIW